MLVFGKFLICAFLIYFAGSRLSKYGDKIADKTGLGHAWIGITLLAAITSLPELFNGISAVALVGEPDLAVGNILGACLINMAVIGGLDIYQYFKGKPSIFSVLGKANNLSAVFGMILAVVFAIGVVLSKQGIDFTLFGVGIFSVLIFATYLIAQRMIFLSAQENSIEAEEKFDGFWLYAKFAFFAGIVIVAGTWLPFIGDEMALSFGLGRSFVGVLFLGIATTLPELVVSSTALKYSVAMAIGNLLGSNIFNLSLLFVDDIFYQAGSILNNVSRSQFYIALFLLLSFVIFLIGLKIKFKSRILSLVLIISYIIGIYTLLLLK